MTVIAYRDGIMAADKQLTFNGLKSTTTKIFRVDDALVGICGTFSLAMEVLEWIKAGAKPKHIPDFQRTDEAQVVMLVRDRQIWMYEQGATPYRQEDAYAAIGSGCDCATAAMWCGKSAVEAVQCAIALNSGCGQGIDALLDHQLATESWPWA